MDSEIKDLLERNIELNEENNRLLRGLRMTNRLSFLWKLVYMVIFFGGAALAFNYVRPYLEQAKASYDSTVETQKKISEGINKYFPTR